LKASPHFPLYLQRPAMPLSRLDDNWSVSLVWVERTG
jgi:hypothetical protein